MKHIVSIIGRGFGDEGKGLATAWLCRQYPDSLVVKHNGGGQAGHTVDLEDGRRFVFHQLSSGSFSHCPTLWASTFYPDLYKLDEEINDFEAMSGFVPDIYCDSNAYIVTVDDVIVNMAMEAIRDTDRHGSCGMGINEADLRTKAGFGIKVSDVINSTPEKLAEILLRNRKEYYPKRFKNLGIDCLPIDYALMFEDSNVIYNAADKMIQNIKYIRVVDEVNLLQNYENIVFETGQGLLLDADRAEYYPHVTASKTGLTNPCRILEKCGLRLNEAIYVTRSYVTRHGAGRLDMESTREALGISEADQTNVPNEWQGSLRYAPFASLKDMYKPILDDINSAWHFFYGTTALTTVSILITHLNETNGNVLFADNAEDVNECVEKLFNEGIQKIYLSYDKSSVEKVSYEGFTFDDVDVENIK